jgi:hypothetical protein
MKMECCKPVLLQCSSPPIYPEGLVNLAVNKRWLCSLVHQDSRQPAANAESEPTEKQSIDMRAVVYNSEVKGGVTGGPDFVFL